jgi:uncharacterized cupredoxin-like copper-binding protein
MSPFWRLSLCVFVLTACSVEFYRAELKNTQPPQKKIQPQQENTPPLHENTRPRQQKKQPLQSPEAYVLLRQQAIDSAFIQGPDKSEPEFIGDRLEVHLANFKFNPSELHLKAGAITQIEIFNTSLIMHYFGGRDFFDVGAEIIRFTDFKVPSGLTHIPVASKTSRIVYLFAKDPGEYSIDCFVPMHTLLGMKGTLFVE